LYKNAFVIILISKNFKIWKIQIQGLFKDLLCFQVLSRAWNFFPKFKDFQGLLKDPMNPDCIAGRSNANMSWIFLEIPPGNLLEICSVTFVDSMG